MRGRDEDPTPPDAPDGPGGARPPGDGADGAEAADAGPAAAPEHAVRPGASVAAGPGSGSAAPTGSGSGAGPRYTDRLPVLLESVLGIGTDLELGVTLQQVVETAVELVEARYVELGVVQPESAPLTELFSAGSDEGGTSAEVPVRVADEVFGSLRASGKRGAGDRPGAGSGFTPHDIVLLHTLAAQAGIAIGNARTYGRARRRERWIQGAAAVTTALLTGESTQDALTTVAESARVLADADAGAVLLPTSEGGMRIVAVSAPDPAIADGMVGTTIRPGSPVLEQLLGGEAVFLEDSATDPRMTTHVRGRFGPSMMLPLQHDGRLIGTLTVPRTRGGRPYTPVDRLLASQFASQAALALVLADAQHDRERLAVFEDRDRIARDLHDLVVQRLFATEMMLESTRRRAGAGETAALLGRATDELDSTIQEVRTAIFALQQPPAEAPTSLRGRVLRETDGAAALLGFRPSVRFLGPVESSVPEAADEGLLSALRGALAAAHRRQGVGEVVVELDASGRLPDGRPVVRLTVRDDGVRDDGSGTGTTATWQAPEP
ncbi:sensor histidine kinase [Streptomyces fuscigenes]|uniref:sensor histidine kinase n=1 Tax=Streptomyces fuscigenes TaxID=1528880 RepID=UPI001F340271|nr:GAF domain-containing protein [Streptomyces fuscigenes]MCF3962127.1 GAF domain-containing protein [Streptomyces fuscigenes]